MEDVEEEGLVYVFCNCTEEECAEDEGREGIDEEEVGEVVEAEVVGILEGAWGEEALEEAWGEEALEGAWGEEADGKEGEGIAGGGQVKFGWYGRDRRYCVF